MQDLAISCTVLSIFVHTHTSVYGPLEYVRGYLGEPLPEPIWILLKQVCELQWHQLGHMEICTLLQADNHARMIFTCHLVPCDLSLIVLHDSECCWFSDTNISQNFVMTHLRSGEVLIIMLN